MLAAVPGTGMRRTMPEFFEKKFGVKLQVVVTPSRQTAQRAIREAAAGAEAGDRVPAARRASARSASAPWIWIQT